jgi:hypothetical protein
MKTIFNLRFWTFGGWFTWVAVAIVGGALIGGGATLIGANKQASANTANNNANIAVNDATNQSNWNNYLVTRGLATNGQTPTGTIPGTTGAVNTKLPLWANVQSSNGPSQWVKSGTAPNRTNVGITGAPAAIPAAAAAPSYQPGLGKVAV